MGPCSSKDGISEPKKAGAAGAPAAAAPQAKVWKSADELQDFNTFFPAGTKSALSRNLTQ